MQINKNQIIKDFQERFMINLKAELENYKPENQIREEKLK